MNGLKIPMAIILAVAIQAIGLVWYVSKIDSKVEILYSQYQESSQEAVIENQVRMRIDLQNVVDGMATTTTQIEQLTQMVEKVRKSNNQLVNQNNKIKNTITNLKKQITDLKKSTKKKKESTEKKLG
jgi:septal ring factor EnvC (AmiA/AmiB activator)